MVDARKIAVLLHRYVGLAIAAFIGVASITGAAIAFIEPLRAALIPDRFVATARGPLLSLADLDARVAAFAPQARITQWPLRTREGRPAEFRVADRDARIEPAAPRLPFDVIELDPVSGQVIGTSRANEGAPWQKRALDFIYRLHYSLAIPGALGCWVMGIAAILWLFDCFIGAWLTLPRSGPLISKWKPAWQVRARRLNFDLHRAAGLWAWGMLALLALSGIQLALPDEIFMPVARAVLDVSPDRLAGHRPSPQGAMLGPVDAAAVAIREARARGWVDAPERLQHSAERGLYRAIFTTPQTQWLTSRRRELYVDDRSGALVAAMAPGRGTRADAALDWLAALHQGQVFGWPWKIVLCLSGLAAAVLACTGIVVWSRKRSARHLNATRRKAPA